MPTFSCREKNDTISVRCGARCRAYHASSMGEAKGRRTTVRRPDSCFLGFSIPWRVPFHMKKAFLSGPIRSEPPATRTWCFTARKALFLRPEAPRHLVRLSIRRLGRGASPSAKPYFFVRKHHAYRLGPPAPQLASPSPQSLNSSSGHANQARPSLRQPGLPFSHKKRMRRIYII